MITKDHEGFWCLEICTSIPFIFDCFFDFDERRYFKLYTITIKKASLLPMANKEKSSKVSLMIQQQWLQILNNLISSFDEVALQNDSKCSPSISTLSHSAKPPHQNSISTNQSLSL
ncbi:hypothetical protein ACTFIR_003257 [Dictyostelium discoideum]